MQERYLIVSNSTVNIDIFKIGNTDLTAISDQSALRLSWTHDKGVKFNREKVQFDTNQVEYMSIGFKPDQQLSLVEPSDSN